jgi:hypothetical protein
VKTITLAPGQTQKVSVTKKVHTKRYRKEVENNLRSWREETKQTSRAEEEIVRRASSRTNFSITSEESLGADVAGTATTTKFEHEASKNSDNVKKAFEEAVFNAAQEYKLEHTTEVSTEETEDFETTETTEIRNENKEIAVTFLFYELQRRYRVNATIYQLTPVVLVAQEMPAPHEIDEDWLVTHDWILRRVILDDSFLPALDYLIENLAGDEVALAQMKVALDKQSRSVEAVNDQVKALDDRLSSLKSYLRLFNEGRYLELNDHPLSNEFRGDKDAVEDAIEKAEEELSNVSFRANREVATLNSLLETYTKTLSEHMNHRTQIARLCVHVKQNILHYMKGIWNHEPPDQRFFRLHNVQVPVLKANERSFTIDWNNVPTDSLVSMAHRRLPRFGRPAVETYRFEAKTKLNPDLEFVPLSELADLDNLLGYKGNYMIFALKESNDLTDFMMDPYVDRALGALIDPDDVGNWSLEDFSKYVCCLKEKLTAEEFGTIRPQLTEQYKRLLTATRRSDDRITIPSGSVFIEALPAEHSLIEKFMAIHRAIDVKKVQAEVRGQELENIRRASRLLAGEREDPDVEKKIVIEGNASQIVVPPDTN